MTIENIVEMLQEMHIPLHTITLQKEKVLSRHSSVI